MLALILGVGQALSFAPFGLPWLQVLALAGLFLLAKRTAGASQAAVLGWFFGMGWFAGPAWSASAAPWRARGSTSSPPT